MAIVRKLEEQQVSPNDQPWGALSLVIGANQDLSLGTPEGGDISFELSRYKFCSAIEVIQRQRNPLCPSDWIKQSTSMIRPNGMSYCTASLEESLIIMRASMGDPMYRSRLIAGRVCEWLKEASEAPSLPV